MRCTTDKVETGPGEVLWAERVNPIWYQREARAFCFTSGLRA